MVWVGEAGIRDCRLDRNTPLYIVEVRPASGESLPLELHAGTGLLAWTQLYSMAFVEPLKHTDDAVSQFSQDRHFGMTFCCEVGLMPQWECGGHRTLVAVNSLTCGR